MYIFAEPVNETQIQKIQSENDAEIAAYERKILGLHDDIEGVPEQDEDGKWADLQADVEKEMNKDEISMNSPVADNSVTPEAFKPDHLELIDLEAANKGPLWNKAQSQSGKGEPIAIAPEGVDMDDEDGRELELSNKSDEKVEEITAGVKASEKGNDFVHREETLYEAANGTYLEGPDEGNEGEISGDAVNADTEQPMEPETRDSLRNMPQTSQNDSSDTEHQAPVPGNEDLFLAADVASDNARARAAATVPSSKEVLAMTLTIRNKVNGYYVDRPERLSLGQQWSVEYAMAEVSDNSKAWNLYQANQARRAKALDYGVDDENKKVDWFIRNLRELSKKGQEWRQKQDQLDQERPRYILGQSSAKGEIYDVGDSGMNGQGQ